MNTPNTSLYENYQAQYAAKLVGVDEALSHIRDGDVIGAGAAAGEPARLLERLNSLNGRVHGLKYYSGLGMRDYPFLSDPACRESFDVDCVFMMGPGRASHRKGLSSVYPAQLHNGAARWMEHNPVNVFMAAVTPMDRHGYFRMSMCLIYGDTEVHISQVDYIVEGDGKMPEIPASEPTAVEQAIGAHIAELVHDGDTIQLGIGGIPDAVGRGLMGKHDLGVHTEMITNSILDLVAAGVVTGRKKTLHRGKIVGAFTLGNRNLYDFLDQSKLFKGTVRKEDRSLMNVPFVTGDADLDAKFVAEAKAAGFENLKGHRTVGGMRASIYNAMPVEGVEKLVEFMKKFEEENA